MNQLIEEEKQKSIFEGLENFKTLYNYLLNLKTPSSSPSHYFSITDKDKYTHLLHSIDFNSLDITLDLSIDFIKIFYHHQNTTPSQYMILLNDNFDKVMRNTNSKRILQAEVTINNITHTIFFTFIIVNNYLKGVSVRLVHPNLDIINHVSNIFSNNYILTSVEYSADLRSNDNEKLLRIISCTMVQKHARSAVNKLYSTTYYASNPRKAFSLGSYVYKKSFQNDEAIRIECRCKRSFFKKQRITTMEDTLKISPNKVFEKVDFKLFNLKRFLKMYLPLNKIDTQSDLETAKLFESQFFDHFSRKYGGGLLSVMTLLKNIGVKHRGTYLDRYPFGEYFLSLLNGKTFG